MEAYITTIDKITNSTEAFDIMKMNDGACVKTFLTSNRSYRYYLLTNGVFTTEQKEVYLQIEMSKSVWISEVATMITSVTFGCGTLRG